MQRVWLKSEFSKRVDLLGIDKKAKLKVLHLIAEAGKEFPCLGCISRGTCENSEWYIKWFTEKP
jgi:hypothetical protein